MPTEDGRPKVFISYCWDYPLTVERVHGLADFLDAQGVHLEMDRYQPPGSNLYRFMQLMVEDRSIDKVFCFIDRAYHRKSLLGEGGVGTEVTILTPEVYAHAAKGDLTTARIVPILFETPEDAGQPMPTMFATAKYEYMVDPQQDDRHMEQLRRLAYGQPAYVRSNSPRVPDDLLTPDNVFGGEVQAAASQVGYHLKQGKTKLGAAAFEEHLQALAQQLSREDPELFAPLPDYHAGRTKLLKKAAERRFPLIKAYASALEAFLKYGEGTVQPLLAQMFGQLLTFNMNARSLQAQDVSRVLTRELFVWTVALHLRHRRYQEAHGVIDEQYLVNDQLNWRTYDHLAYDPRDLRDERFLAELSQAIWEGTGLPLDEAVQAEIVLAVWGSANGQQDVGWPWTNVRAWMYHSPMLFQRVRNVPTMKPLSEVFGVQPRFLVGRLREFSQRRPTGRLNWQATLRLDTLAGVADAN